ncbi:Os05g0345100, partial [Oryza sativa Japonica Group]
SPLGAIVFFISFQAGATITWDLVVGGWELEYGAEYVPAAEDSYTLCVERTRKVPAAADEPVHNAFTAREAGKMVLSIDNSGSRKRKVAAYRYFVRKPSA